MLSKTIAESDPMTAVLAARERGIRLQLAGGGFPVLAESLRSAGVCFVHCNVASMTTLYRTHQGAVIDQQVPILSGLERVVDFECAEVIAAIRRDQQGASTYPEFMVEIWRAGVISYDIDLVARTCTYRGLDPAVDVHVEEYPAVELID